MPRHGQVGAPAVQDRVQAQLGIALQRAQQVVRLAARDLEVLDNVVALERGQRRYGSGSGPLDFGALETYCCYMQPNAPTRPGQPDTGLLADATALQAAVAELVRIYQYRDRDRICCYDISVTQCHALEALMQGGPMRSQALAERLMLDKSTTTRVIDSLVRKGYAERTTAADDARAVTLCIRPEGQALYQRIHAELVAQQAEILAEVDPAVRAASTEILRRLARAAQARFLSGVSVGTCAPACTPSSCG